MNCPICKTKQAYVGFNANIECINPECLNFSSKWREEICPNRPTIYDKFFNIFNFEMPIQLDSLGCKFFNGGLFAKMIGCPDDVACADFVEKNYGFDASILVIDACYHPEKIN